MQVKKTPIALALALMSVAPFAAQAAPSNVTFKTPLAGAQLSGTISQSAACEVTGTNIKKVVFSLVSASGQQTALNTETSAPWNCNITTKNFADGNYTLRAVAYDAANSGVTVNRSVSIKNTTTTTNTPPSVSFTKPLNGANVPTGALACAVNASDADGIAKVDWYLDGTLVTTDTTAPYDTCNFNLTAGTHTLRAVATDKKGASSSTQISVTAGTSTTPPGGGTTTPVVKFTKPLNGATLALGPNSCVVTATGANPIATLQWYQDGKLINTEKMAPYDTCLANLPAGTHVLKAVATDSKGNVGSAEVTVTAGSSGGGTSNTPPTVNIMSPAAGSKLTGSSNPYQASATDTGGTVAKVDMYLISGATQKLVDSKSAAPYSGTINTAGVPNGAATLRAVATDNLGMTSQTDRAVTVDNTVTPPPGGGGGTPGGGTTVPANGSRGVATFESVGLYWKPGNNPGADGCTVRFRKYSESAWKQGLNMWYDSRNSECRGSIVHLEPGTDYAVEMGSGSATAGVNIKTWAESFPIAQTINVASGSGTLNITQGGTPDGYVLYQGPATLDAGNAVDWNIVVSAPYVIIRGLTLKGAKRDGIKLQAPAHDVVIEDNDISGWGRPSGVITPDGWNVQVDGDSGISANCYGAAGPWLERTIIQRNKIHDPRYGANSWADGHPKGANAVWFNDCGGNHVFRYNEIYAAWGKWFMDGFGGWENFSARGTPNSDSDLYGNIIRNVWDDAIEAEGGNTNVRIWGNYMDQTATGVASTAVITGPLYIWRNVWNRSRGQSRNVDSRLYMFKSGSTTGGGGRRYVFHNTMLQAPASTGSVYPNGGGTLTQGGSQGLAAPGGGQNLTNTVSRNNIFQIYKNWWSSVDDAGGGSPANDLDYDLVNGNVTAGTGAEPNRIVGVPVYKAGHGWVSDAGGNYQLEAGSPGLDAGVLLPNFNDAFSGSAPDMGAQESGSAPMKLGVSGSSAIWSQDAASAPGSTATTSTAGGTTTGTTGGTTTSTTGGTTTTSSTGGGVCSSASCVATQ